VGYSPNSGDVSTEAEEYPLLRCVTRKRLEKADCAPVICKAWRLAIALQLLVVPSCVYKWSINPFTNPSSNTCEYEFDFRELMSISFNEVARDLVYSVECQDGDELEKDLDGNGRGQI
jgi:hypothetical protein